MQTAETPCRPVPPRRIFAPAVLFCAIIGAWSFSKLMSHMHLAAIRQIGDDKPVRLAGKNYNYNNCYPRGPWKLGTVKADSWGLPPAAQPRSASRRQAQAQPLALAERRRQRQEPQYHGQIVDCPQTRLICLKGLAGVEGMDYCATVGPA